jgi:putative hydrolase of the HAD superfamily
MIKALIFDFGQTLVNSADGFRTAEKTAQNKIFTEMDSDPNGPGQDEFLHQYRLIRKASHQRSDFSRLAIWQTVFRQFGFEPDRRRLEQWETDYWAQVKARTAPFPETVRVLQILADRYRLAIITNTQGQKSSGNHRIALFPQIEKFFKVIIVAGESGIPPKPAPEPFRLCLKKLNVTAKEAVFIGDDWRIDICGAQNAGIRPVWLQHHSVHRNWPDVKTDLPIITRLDQLSGLHELSR